MDRHYVGIDFHRRRSVVVCKNEAGEVVSKARIANNPAELTAALQVAGPAPEVILEATYGWYWAVDLLEALDCTVHLANPSQLNWGHRRVKNDERDAIDLIDLLRIGRLPEASSAFCVALSPWRRRGFWAARKIPTKRSSCREAWSMIA